MISMIGGLGRVFVSLARLLGTKCTDLCLVGASDLLWFGLVELSLEKNSGDVFLDVLGVVSSALFVYSFLCCNNLLSISITRDIS